MTIVNPVPPLNFRDLGDQPIRPPQTWPDGSIADWLIDHDTDPAVIAAWTQRLTGGP